MPSSDFAAGDHPIIRFNSPNCIKEHHLRKTFYLTPNMTSNSVIFLSKVDVEFMDISLIKKSNVVKSTNLED